jgi:hypothetical protein
MPFVTLNDVVFVAATEEPRRKLEGSRQTKAGELHREHKPAPRPIGGYLYRYDNVIHAIP